MEHIMQTLASDNVSRTDIPSDFVKKTSLKQELSAADIDFIMANTTFEKDHILKWFDEFKSQCPNFHKKSSIIESEIQNDQVFSVILKKSPKFSYQEKNRSNDNAYYSNNKKYKSNAS